MVVSTEANLRCILRLKVSNLSIHCQRHMRWMVLGKGNVDDYLSYKQVSLGASKWWCLIEGRIGRSVSYRNLRVFWCLAYVHVAKDQRSKLDNKSKPCIFPGYSEDEFGYRLWDLIDKKVVRSRDIVFMEGRLKTRNNNQCRLLSQLLLWIRHLLMLGTRPSMRKIKQHYVMVKNLHMRDR